MNDNQAKGIKWRVCVIGDEKISWDITMNYKRSQILIDTAGDRPQLAQVSFVTGANYHKIRENTMVKIFLTHFSMSSSIRPNFKKEESDKV